LKNFIIPRSSFQLAGILANCATTAGKNTNPAPFSLRKTPAASQLTFVVGQPHFTVIFYVLKNKQLSIKPTGVNSKKYFYFYVKTK
jgi:hypothetical protein